MAEHDDMVKPFATACTKLIDAALELVTNHVGGLWDLNHVSLTHIIGKETVLFELSVDIAALSVEFAHRLIEFYQLLADNEKQGPIDKDTVSSSISESIKTLKEVYISMCQELTKLALRAQKASEGVNRDLIHHKPLIDSVTDFFAKLVAELETQWNAFLLTLDTVPIQQSTVTRTISELQRHIVLFYIETIQNEHTWEYGKRLKAGLLASPLLGNLHNEKGPTITPELGKRIGVLHQYLSWAPHWKAREVKTLMDSDVFTILVHLQQSSENNSNKEILSLYADIFHEFPTLFTLSIAAQYEIFTVKEHATAALVLDPCDTLQLLTLYHESIHQMANRTRQKAEMLVELTSKALKEYSYHSCSPLATQKEVSFDCMVCVICTLRNHVKGPVLDEIQKWKWALSAPELAMPWKWSQYVFSYKRDSPNQLFNIITELILAPYICIGTGTRYLQCFLDHAKFSHDPGAHVQQICNLSPGSLGHKQSDYPTYSFTELCLLADALAEDASMIDPEEVTSWSISSRREGQWKSNKATTTSRVSLNSSVSKRFWGSKRFTDSEDQDTEIESDRSSINLTVDDRDDKTVMQRRKGTLLEGD